MSRPIRTAAWYAARDASKALEKVRKPLRAALLGGATTDACVRAMADALANLAQAPGTPSDDRSDAFWGRVDKTGDCWLWTARTRTVALRSAWGSLTPKRYAWVAYKLPLPQGRILVSKCGNSACVRPDHHRLGLPGEGKRKPRSPDARPTNAKLTPDDVRQIRAALGRGVRQRDLAAQFGVGRETIVSISTRATWAHLPDEPETP